MRNWIRTPVSNLINMDHITQVRLHQQEEKWYVVGDIAGKDAAFLMSVGYATEDEAKAELAAIEPSL